MAGQCSARCGTPQCSISGILCSIVPSPCLRVPAFPERRTPRRGGRSVAEGSLPAPTPCFCSPSRSAANELRESFHHWVRTLRFPVTRDRLGSLLSYIPPAEDRPVVTPLSAADIQLARDLWDEIRQDVRQVVTNWADRLTEHLRAALGAEHATAVQRERERFQSRQGELSHLIQQQSLARLEREIDELVAEQQQGTLFDTEQRVAELARSQRAKEEEVARRRVHYEELRRLLDRERERVLGVLLPRRYAMRGDAQVLPVAVEIRLPGEARKV
jgi:hypothetical protein